MSLDLGTKEVLAFRALVGERTGLHFDDDQVSFLGAVLRTRLDETRSALDAYLRRLESGDREEVGSLAAQLTVGETYFFRHAEQFHAFRDIALPAALARRRESRRLRILSLGSASGEEAYTLAIILREQHPEIRLDDFELRGIDINPLAIERARRARYTAWSLRDVPPHIRASHFRATGAEFGLDSAIRNMASFDVRSLLDDDGDLWREESADIVFCRNVIMYLNASALTVLLGRIARVLRYGGHLFLGHAETLRGATTDLHLRHTHGTFYYERMVGTPVSAPGLRTKTPLQAPAFVLEGSPRRDEPEWVDSILRASERIARLDDDLRAMKRPTDGASAGGGLVDVDLCFAMDLLRQERFLDALAALDALPPEASAEPGAQLLRAVLLTNTNQAVRAEETCAKLLTSDEPSAGAQYVVGLLRARAGDSASATACYRAAASIDPDFAMPRLQLGLVSRRAGDLDAARGHLEAGLGLLRSDDPARVTLFGGGFAREALASLFRAELERCGSGR